MTSHSASAACAVTRDNKEFLIGLVDPTLIRNTRNIGNDRSGIPIGYIVEDFSFMELSSCLTHSRFSTIDL